jgi:hypothetical protein
MSTRPSAQRFESTEKFMLVPDVVSDEVSLLGAQLVGTMYQRSYYKGDPVLSH